MRYSLYVADVLLSVILCIVTWITLYCMTWCHTCCALSCSTLLPGFHDEVHVHHIDLNVEYCNLLSNCFTAHGTINGYAMPLVCVVV